MKAFVVLASLMAASVSFAQNKHLIAGSDTLAGVMTDAIIAAGMDQVVGYVGGGSGNGEKALANAEQGIAPMSREFNVDLANTLATRGVRVKPHVLALDGIAMFVQKNNPLASLDVQTIARIYSCEFTKWEQIPGSGLRGDIRVYRRNDASGTTDAFKHFTGLKKFGACVTVVNETADISEHTSREPLALGYAGLSGKVDGNRALALAAKPGDAAVNPTTQTIRSFKYPFARRLYLYEVEGTRTTNPAERDLLNSVLDRSFMDPIMQAHEFITID